MNLSFIYDKILVNLVILVKILVIFKNFLNIVKNFL